MAINWYQDSGDIIVPNQKKEVTQSGVVLFKLPHTVERFVKGWTYNIDDFTDVIGDDGVVNIALQNASNIYYLADKPNVEVKHGKFKEGDNDKVYFISLHIFYIDLGGS